MRVSSPLILSSIMLSAILLTYPHIATAQDGSQSDIRPYVGVAVEAIDLESFDSPTGFDLFPEATTTAVFRGGVVVHKNFAIEGEIALGIDNQDGDGIAEYGERFAGYGRLRYPFGDSGFEIFTRLGYASTTVDSNNVIGDGTMGGVSYGGGIAFSFGGEDQYQIRGDFTQFEFGNNQNSSAFALGIGYNF